jgi:aryl-alcohol dehydrogenase-like predicted oxidoreductase
MLRKLGAHGPEISTVVYGAWQAGGWFWGESDDQEQIRAMHAAFDAGVNAIDTAPVYGMGHSEEVVGKAVAGRPDVVVLTKCGLRWNTPVAGGGPTPPSEEGAFFFDTTTPDGRKWTIRRHAAKASILAECEASLKRLRREAIDVYQLHWPEPGRAPEEIMEAMNELLRAGKIRAIGVSNCDPAWMTAAKAVAPLTSDQPKWSWLSRREDATIAWCAENGVGTVVYSPLEMGLLSGKIGRDYTFAPGDERPRSNPWFKPANLDRVHAALAPLRPIAQDKGCSLAQLMLAATIAQPGITAVLVGARNAAQSADNARAMSVSLSEAELAEIRSAFGGIGKP